MLDFFEAVFQRARAYISMPRVAKALADLSQAATSETPLPTLLSVNRMLKQIKLARHPIASIDMILGAIVGLLRSDSSQSNLVLKCARKVVVASLI